MSTGFQCPACGFGDLAAPPYDEAGAGSEEICPSCRYQFGVTDDDHGIGFADWRAVWVKMGKPWRTRPITQPPPGWDPDAQLAALAGKPR